MGPVLMTGLLILGSCGFLIAMLSGTGKLPRVSLIVAAAWMTFGYNHTVPPDTARFVYLATQAILVLSIALSPRWLHRRRYVALVIVWFLANIVSTFVMNPSSVLQLSQLAVLSVATIWNFLILRASEWTPLIKRFVALAFVHAIVALVEVWTHHPIFWGYPVIDGSFVIYQNPLFPDGLARIQGTLGHPIALSVLLGLATLILVFSRKVFPSWTKSMLFTTFAGAAVLSGSRSTLIAFGIASVIHLFSRETKNKAAKWLAVVLGALIVYVGDFGLRQSAKNLVNSGSFENRAEGIASIPGLFQRPIFEVVFGSGTGSEDILFESGFLQQSDFGVVDNQLVTTLATNGLFGLFGLLLILILAFRRSSLLGRRLVIFMVVMMFSFDYLRWPAISFLFFVALGVAMFDEREVKHLWRSPRSSGLQAGPSELRAF